MTSFHWVSGSSKTLCRAHGGCIDIKMSSSIIAIICIAYRAVHKWFGSAFISFFLHFFLASVVICGLQSIALGGNETVATHSMELAERTDSEAILIAIFCGSECGIIMME